MKKVCTKSRKEAALLPDHFLLCRFDYARYAELRPKLRVATLPTHFEKFCTTPELQESLLALEEELISPELLRQEIVRAECCLASPLELDSAFPRFVRELAQRSKTSDAAVLFSELLAGQRHLESWLRADGGLLGILTPDDALSLEVNLLVLVHRGYMGSRAGRRRRRGGLIGHIGSFLRGLFASPPSDDELLSLLNDLLSDANGNDEGLALLAA